VLDGVLSLLLGKVVVQEPDNDGQVLALIVGG
jgi:hypothetical protein